MFAVRKKRVVVSGDTIEELLSEIEKSGENPDRLLIEAIPPKDASFIL